MDQSIGSHGDLSDAVRDKEARTFKGNIDTKSLQGVLIAKIPILPLGAKIQFELIQLINF
jgi:hypothetical protein